MSWTSKATPFAAGVGATAAAAVVAIPLIASSFSDNPVPAADGGPKEATSAKFDLSIAPGATATAPAEAGPASAPQLDPSWALVADQGIAAALAPSLAAATGLFVPPTSNMGFTATGTQTPASPEIPAQPVLSFGLGGAMSMEMPTAGSTASAGTVSMAQSASATGTVVSPNSDARTLSAAAVDTPLGGSDLGTLGSRSPSVDQATVVPEPAALMLFGVGVLGLVWTRRRRSGMRRKPARAAASMPHRSGESESWPGC